MGFMEQLKEQFSFGELMGFYQSYKRGELDMHHVLTDEFMQKYTDFDNLAAFSEKLGVKDNHQLIDFMKESANRQRADQIVKEHTQFDSLIEMVKTALGK
jgi:hypothetical protein